MTDTIDQYWIRHALTLAERGRFSASPNPCVGCVIVKDGKLIGEGFHERAGEPHAEVHALRMAGEQAAGATAYVTLEPCAHYGRTPPCANALVDAKVTRVVIACTDPNPLVAGKGIAILNAAGISTTVGVMENEALKLNRAFFHKITTGRPYVTLKLAASIDGRTALANGESQWITGEAARLDVQYQRLAADAIMAGTGSVITDNARLTARYPTEQAANQPLRIIIDSLCRTPLTAAVFQEQSPVLLATTNTTPPPYPEHVEVLRFPTTVNGKVPLATLINTLSERSINHLFIEAGANLAGAVLDAELADEILLYLAPTILGSDAQPLANITPLACLSDKISYRITDSRAIGDDWRFILTRKA